MGSRFKIEGRGIAKPGEVRGDLFVILEPNSSDAMREDAMRGSFAGLVDVLDDNLKVIPTVGHEFDPELHEAVRVAHPGEGPLVITGEVRRGYTVKGQVIRPALVTVAYQKEQLGEGTQHE
ncbi:MAG: nucleotide exchange factor GrpE, partial [Acidimicrobiia bacterium]|nr:nucleotide exchange factor GrpE [Acidimicrobiia bacterium]